MPQIQVSASEFKARCARLIDDVSRRGGEVVITKRGRPVAKVVAVKPPKRKSLFGCAKGMITIHGDIVAPLDEEWEALK